MELLESAQQPEYKPHNAPILEGQQSLPQEMADKIDNYVHENQIDKIVNSPLLKILLIPRIPEAQKYITENFREYEPLIYEYVRSKYPSIYNLINQGENNAGLTNTPPFQADTRMTGQSGLNGEFEDIHTKEIDEEEISEELYDEAMNWAYELYQKKSYTLAKISEGLRIKYQIDMHPVVLAKRMKEMAVIREFDKPIVDEEELPYAQDIAQKSAIQKILADNKRLRDENDVRKRQDEINQAVNEALSKQPRPQPGVETRERKGVIRRLIAWVW